MNLLKLTKRMVNMYDRHSDTGGILDQATLEDQAGNLALSIWTLYDHGFGQQDESDNDAIYISGIFEKHVLDHADLEAGKRINKSLVNLVNELYPEED